MRVSTEGQAQEGLSLETQRARLEAYCVAMDLELLDVVTDEMSARSLNRPGIQRVLKQLEQGEADALVIAKLDRLTRSVRDLGTLVENYFSEGKPWSLLSVGDSIDTRTASGRLVLNVLGSVSQWEREAIGERTREALATVRAQGFRLGNPRYGYRWSDKLDEHGRKTVEPDPEKQRVIALICDMFDRAIPVAEIYRAINRDDVRKVGHPLHRMLIYRVLKSTGRLPARLRDYQPRPIDEPPPEPHDAGRCTAVAAALRAQGLSLRAIGEALKTQGLRPPRGEVWHASTVLVMLGYQRP